MAHLRDVCLGCEGEKETGEREREREEGGDNVTLWELHKEGYLMELQVLIEPKINF